MPSDMMLCVISYWVLSGAKQRQIQQLRCCVFPAKLLKRRDVYLKLTRHNGRAGTHGTYNPKHNDRSFNLANSEHIDPERAKGNIYWDCFHGFRSALDPPDPDDLAATFSDVERQFYESHYTPFIENQNEHNAKIRHTERKPRLELTEKIEANFYSQDLTPAASQPRQNEKPVATKISGKEILEAIRLMDADERRELTRALFA